MKKNKSFERKQGENFYGSCQWNGKSVFVEKQKQGNPSDKAIGEFVMLQLLLWICQCQPICCCGTECAEIIAKV